ncbi:hypothetical protein Q8F57_044145 [Paraburkholderia terrae]
MSTTPWSVTAPKLFALFREKLINFMSKSPGFNYYLLKVTRVARLNRAGAPSVDD